MEKIFSRLIRALFCIFFVFGLSSCGLIRSTGEELSTSAGETSIWFTDLINSDENDELKELPEIESKAALQLIEKHNLSGGLGRQFPRIQPAQLKDLIVVSDEDRLTLSAYSLEGDRLWRTLIGEKISGGIGIAQGAILVGTNQAGVYAIDSNSGEPLWQARVSSEVLSPPASSDDVVVVNTVDGKLFGLNLSDGQQKWMIEREVPALTLRGTSTPATGAGVAVSGFANGHLVAVDLQSGIEIWDEVAAFPKGRTELDRLVDADSRVLIDDNIVYSTTFQGRLVAVGLESGSSLWGRNISSLSSVSINRETLFVTDVESNILALDRRSGKTLWKQKDLRGRRLTAPVFYKNYVVLGDPEGYVHILDAENGDILGRDQFDDDPISIDPWVQDDHLYLFNDEGELMVLGTGGEIQSPKGSLFSMPKFSMPKIIGGDGEEEPGVGPKSE